MIFLTRGEQLGDWDQMDSEEGSFLIVKHVKDTTYQIEKTQFNLEDLKVICAQELEDDCYYIGIVPGDDIIYLVKMQNQSEQVEAAIDNFAKTVAGKDEFISLFKK